MGPSDGQRQERVVGRYALYGEIASGGMATVHFGRMVGSVGFSKTVAIKCLHSQFAKDPDFVSMFVDEARLAARIQHPNVVSTLDIVSNEGELFLVMEYIRGESLSRLMRTARRGGERMPPRIVATIVSGLLHGLHAAHEATDEQGQPLGIVHRDVSPQNVLVGTDGVARVLDFGVAKAAGRLSATRDGQLKGKFAYMAPEQIRGGAIDRRTDIYAAAVVLWEALTGKRMIDGDTEAVVLNKVLEGQRQKPSEVNPALPKSLDVVSMRGLEMDPGKRYPTAKEMAFALERAIGLASQREVGEWVERAAADALATRAARIKEIEARSTTSVTSPSVAEIISTTTGSGQPPRAAGEEEGKTTVWTATSTNPMGHMPSGDVGTASKVTSFTGTTMPEPQPRQHNAALIALAAAALMFAGVAVAALVILARGQNNPAPAPATSVIVVTATASAAAPPVSATVAVAAVSAPAATAQAAGGAPAAGGGSKPSSGGPGPGAAAAGKTSKPASAPADPPPKPKAGNCDPPYSIDANGIKRPKPECF